MSQNYEDFLNQVGITDYQEQETVLNFIKSMVSIVLERNNQ